MPQPSLRPLRTASLPVRWWSDATLREELRIADEQLIPLSEAADDARLRALVSETPVAEREHREAARHAESMRTHRASVAAEIDRLERTQDELLDRLLAESS